jgi:hypothetical protein
VLNHWLEVDQEKISSAQTWGGSWGQCKVSWPPTVFLLPCFLEQDLSTTCLLYREKPAMLLFTLLEPHLSLSCVSLCKTHSNIFTVSAFRQRDYELRGSGNLGRYLKLKKKQRERGGKWWTGQYRPRLKTAALKTW